MVGRRMFLLKRKRHLSDCSLFDSLQRRICTAKRNSDSIRVSQRNSFRDDWWRWCQSTSAQKYHGTNTRVKIMAMKRGLSRQSVRDFYISLDYLGNLASFYLGFDGRRTLSRPILGGRFSIILQVPISNSYVTTREARRESWQQNSSTRGGPNLWPFFKWKAHTYFITMAFLMQV